MDVPFPKVWHGRPLLHPFGPKGPWAWRNSVGLRDFAGEGRNSVVHLHIPLPIYHILLYIYIIIIYILLYIYILYILYIYIPKIPSRLVDFIMFYTPCPAENSTSRLCLSAGQWMEQLSLAAWGELNPPFGLKTGIPKQDPMVKKKTVSKWPWGWIETNGPGQKGDWLCMFGRKKSCFGPKLSARLAGLPRFTNKSFGVLGGRLWFIFHYI
jgi:hypothetical protein